MGSRDQHFVTPPTSMGRELLVGYKAAGAEDLDSFDTINDALDYIANLPVEDAPALDNSFMIRCHPSVYPENIWLPNFVGLLGLASLGTAISGDPDHRNKPVVSIGVSYVSNITILPSSLQAAGIFIRNANSGFTADETDFGSIGAGNTLIVNHATSVNTITFAGTETDADDVAAAITAQGTTIRGVNRYGRVEVRPSGSPPSGAPLTVKSTGTVNAALGFSDSNDETFESPGIEIMITDNVIITSTTDGVLNTDIGGGSYISEGLLLIGNTDGVHLEAGSTMTFSGIAVFFCQNGIRLEDNAEVAMYSGFSSANAQYDIILEGANSFMDARSFAYAKRSGVDGIIVPAGSRITFEFNVAGAISTGTEIDGPRLIPFDCTVESVSMVRSIAGNTGQTTVDLNRIVGASPVTLYTTQGNRPSIPANAGDYAYTLAALPDILQLSQGQLLSMDIDDRDVPQPSGLNVVVTAVVN